MNGKITLFILLVAVFTLGNGPLAWAAPQISLNTVSIAQGQTGTLSLALSGGTEAYAGVNATFDLPAGMSLVSVSRGPLTPGSFSVDSHKSVVSGKERVAVIAYSGIDTFNALSGTLLNIIVQASASAALGNKTVTVGTTGLSNEDGSTSVVHSKSNGTITISKPSDDTTGPTLTITSPYDGQHVDNPNITLSGTATDSGKGDNGIQQVTVNEARATNDTATGSGTASWSKSVTLNPGSNIINVVAYDNSSNHNQTSKPIEIHYDVPGLDVTGPALVITSPKNGERVDTPNITLRGTATDAGAGDNGIQQVTVNGTRATNDTATGSGTASWSKSVTLNPGSNTITVIAYDNSASHNQTSKVITIHSGPVNLKTFPFFDDFSADMAWTGYGAGSWERGPATGGGGENGNPDPALDHSGTPDNYILGFAIGGDYPGNMTEESSITSPPVDCTGQNQVLLKFWRFLNVESSQYDDAKVYASNDGTNWTQVWENPVTDLTDSEWTQVVIDISSVAANQPFVYVRFSMVPTNSSRQFSGWNIDDVEITSTAIDPVEGTVGTEFTIWAPELGVKKGKVLIGDVSQKVTGWAEGSVDALLKKAMPASTYDVTIAPKGLDQVVLYDGFTVKGPEIESITNVLSEITIKGRFFGTKKGKVTLEYPVKGTPKTKKCKVTLWWMDPQTGASEIKFIAPKDFVSGTYPLKVINAVGEVEGELEY